MDIICYLSNGYPTLKGSHQIALAYAKAGCQMIEVDFPSKNPYLESEYIAGRMKKALASCNDYNKYMEEIIALKRALPKVKILILIYENTIYELGTDVFIRFCTENGLQDIILVGLKDETVKTQLIAAGIQVSCYVQFHMPEQEIESAKQSNGFLYLQAKPYDGQAVNKAYPTLKDCITHLRECEIQRPIYCGVGIHNPEDVKMVKEAGGDAAFVGSAILRLWDRTGEMQDKIREFKAQCG